jgi:hypothetical protein
LHDDPDHAFSEAVGVVQATSIDGGDPVLKIVTKKRGLVTVPGPDVVALKVFA